LDSRMLLQSSLCCTANLFLYEMLLSLRIFKSSSFEVLNLAVRRPYNKLTAHATVSSSNSGSTGDEIKRCTLPLWSSFCIRLARR